MTAFKTVAHQGDSGYWPAAALFAVAGAVALAAASGAARPEPARPEPERLARDEARAAAVETGALWRRSSARIWCFSCLDRPNPDQDPV